MGCTIRGSIPGGGKELYSNLQTGFGAQIISCSKTNGSSPVGDKTAMREIDHSSTSSAALLNLGCTDPLGSMVMFQGAWNLDGKKITTLFSLYTN